MYGSEFLYEYHYPKGTNLTDQADPEPSEQITPQQTCIPPPAHHSLGRLKGSIS